MHRLARALSIVGHPVATMLVFAAAMGARGGAGPQALVVAAGVILPVGILVAWRHGTGRWRTVDASDPQDRPALYGVALLAAVGVLGAVVALGHAGAARAVAGVVLVFAGGAALSRWLKTSLHVAFAAFGATSLFWIGSPVAWALAAIAAPLAWSRVRLGRHTAREVLAGAVVGVGAALVIQVR